MAFPTLSTNPLVTPHENNLEDGSTIASPVEAGYVQTRPRFTRIREEWHVSYSGLPAADRTALRAHEVAVKVGADYFSWTDPVTGTSHNVRYTGPIKYKLDEAFDSTGAHTWSADFNLKEL